eukprot:14072440-Alexandrium_andersonii.AAC.1
MLRERRRRRRRPVPPSPPRGYGAPGARSQAAEEGAARAGYSDCAQPPARLSDAARGCPTGTLPSPAEQSKGDGESGRGPPSHLARARGSARASPAHRGQPCTGPPRRAAQGRAQRG